jgi:hypothetical protein
VADVPLHVDEVDLESLVLARNDVHPDGDWWFDPRNGESLYHGLDDDGDVPALVGGVHVVVPRAPQPRSDIDDFLVSDEVADQDGDVLVRLDRARRGKGGLRRFREVVQRTPAADAWARFTLRQESIRAIDWLLERGLVEEIAARRRRDELAGGYGSDMARGSERG